MQELDEPDLNKWMILCVCVLKEAYLDGVEKDVPRQTESWTDF